MESFQRFILFSAIIILIIALVFIGVTLTYSKEHQWPPVTPECPDYWIAEGSGDNTTCVNMKNLGTCPPKSGDKYLKMDFNNATFSGSNGICAKYTWAKNCGVSWDGITYGISNPCQKI
jgi:hypothetical protein